MSIKLLTNRAHKLILELCAQRWFQIAVVIPSVVAAIVLGSCAHHRVWSWEQFRTYRAMDRELDPVWKDLHHGRIRAGHDVEDVIARTNPQRIERFDRYVVLTYRHGELRHFWAGLQISAQDGKLVQASAWGRFWQQEFFNVLTAKSSKEFDKAHSNHWAKKRKQMENRGQEPRLRYL